MRRPVVRASAGRVVFLSVILSVLAAGCQPSIGVPGATGSALPKAPPVSAATAIGLVIPSEGVQVSSVYEQIFRHEASQAGIVCEVITAEPGKEARAIREMVQRGVASMVVVPAPDELESVGSALAEVRDQGIPVALLERRAPTSEPPLPLVAFGSLDETADELVGKAVEKARASGAVENFKAVLLINGPFDAMGREKIAALHGALKKAGIETLDDLHFEGFQNEAHAALDPFIAEHPEIGLVLAIEDQGIMTAADLRDLTDPKDRHFVYAGFAMSPDTVKMADFGLSAGMVLQNPKTLARHAYRIAVALAEGKPIPEPTLQTAIALPKGEEKEGYFPRAQATRAVH